ncbi:MAG: indole-3-glycerol phosphate synthase TrpC [Betaproteobacteria bacterium]|nr:indole-3-glycerol phosphate synthase TrpC [Betaproteobacteria bacterium]
MAQANILQKILATKYREVADAAARESLAQIEARARRQPPSRDFVGALHARHARHEPAVIAEIKKASPSAGRFRGESGDFDAARFAQSYAAHGAACLSVLTDKEYFQGSADDLVAARAACDLPVLRKDFIVDPYQVFEARAMGADAVLFIMGAVDIALFREWETVAASLGLAVLAESHNEAELTQALTLRTPLIGINNRDLTRFVTDLEVSARLSQLVPPGRTVVSESGINNRSDVQRLQRSKVNTYLVGGALMASPDPGKALAGMFAGQ